MFENKLRGKILVIFSDPGGAKPCLSIFEDFNKLNLKIISDRKYSFYNDFKSTVEVLKNDIEISTLIDEFDPDVLFTGTSYTSDLERKAISYAKKNGVFTISFVDHWTSISNRFLNPDGLNFPDEIWVLDERAKHIAILEKIVKEKLFIVGNPYHIWLKKWKPKVERKDFFNSLKLDETKKMILFAPDPLSNVNGIEKFGFDEYIASKEIVKCVKETNDDFKQTYHFLIKMHPNQCVEELARIFEANDNFTILPLDVNTNECIYFSDIVMGFFSSFLMEADVMNKPIIRFLINELKNDPFLGLNVGVKTNGESLVNNIKKFK
ncbi:hypothetical protein [Flavobacterium chungangensis]|uniref:CDP-glycerol--glycerophosphate glycerophosphotransferase n=1 Tax=Flavobacterium chungangensis TaxID=2708132 RepID=A0ABV8ZFU1_9FLAO